MLAGLPGCSPKLEIADVAGSYEATYSYGVETLTLKTDGTYEQSFKYNDGRGLSNKGTWQFGTVTENVLDLNDALIVDDGFGKPTATAATPQKGVSGIRARKNILTGAVSLIFNEDLGVAYKKKR